MTAPGRRVLLALAVVALAQTGVLAWTVADRVWLLKTGRDIVLPIVPVDPHDLLRGEYVRLTYQASRLPVRLLEGPKPQRNAPIYVVLESKDGGAWQPIKLSAVQPAESGATRIVLKGSTPYGWPPDPAGSVEVHYGIEDYFVPQGHAPRLQTLARDKQLAARIAVDARGNAAIKGLIVDGVEAYSESFF